MEALLLLCLAVGVLAGGQPLDVCATCHADATCDEKPDGNGKVCHCKYGLVGNGRTYCLDKDECQIGANKICGQSTSCHNTHGSFYCTCLSGYQPSNNMAVFIPNDGTHCQDVDECLVPGLCGDGARCTNVPGSVQCSCRLGYRVQDGPEPFDPRRGGPFCTAVDCGRPTPVEDAILLSVTGTTHLGVATFACAEGFTWRGGDNSSVCGADGLWSPASIRCEEVDCGPPPPLPHARALWNQGSKVGARAFYRCDYGYHNVGEGNVSVCGAAGRWEGAGVVCEETLCGRPPVIESAEQAWSNSSRPGGAVLYFCKDGYREEVGGNVSVCSEEGEWSVPSLVCTEISCGRPPLLPHTGRRWNGSSTPGTVASYYCKIGFYHNGGANESLCTRDGHWTQPSISCREVSCPDPVFKPHAETVWDGAGRVGSVVFYRCGEGFKMRGLKNSSECGANGLWEDVDLWCEEISCGPPLNLPHTNPLWDGGSRPGAVVLYECVEGFYPEGGTNMSTCLQSGEWGTVSVKCRAKCGPVPRLVNSEVVWHNRSVVIHRCVPGYHSWRGGNTSVCGSSGLWLQATLTCIEMKPPITQLLVFNEQCLRWRAEKYEGDTEVYKVTYAGTRDYQSRFHHQRKRSLSSKADRVELCLNLLPVTNYSFLVTAVTAGFTAGVTTNTSLPAPPTPDIDYREFETPLPTLELRRSVGTLDPISLYQVFVLPVEGTMVFDCSDPSGDMEPSSSYITAQIHLKGVGTEVNFTVGDGLDYGGFLNVPLKNGRDYYIFLRAVSRWKMDSKSSCVLWAKVKGISYAMKVSSLSAAATVGLVVLIILGGYSFTWFLKKI